MKYYRALMIALVAVCLGLLTACSEGPANATSRDQLTYDQIVNTGLANVCPRLEETTRGSLPIEAGKTYELYGLCMEPQQYFVKEEPTNKRQEAEFVEGKVLTRNTSSLDQVRGTIIASQDGVLTFKEEGGIDFQAITVLLPGGEQIPLLFTIKELVATTEPGFDSINTSTDFEGEYSVPSYRGAVFLDPKGRGVAAGYDNAVALPSVADADDLKRANVKRVVTGQGEASLQVTKVDSDTGEIAGTFVNVQPSDSDLGADDPEEVKVKGIFYARVRPAT
ncbi:MAG: Photosystem II manganese-stabilizing polypeptide [Spirulinaceae cyanobacterium RM2_2_10]|nr:Photosystem II manganese-stabilizing polypeptide [Spirulinaceae cyanobacterium SM2_1_0]NJO20726.1 Photosystem II manganese-stabilizing polypeptide [Spirulinaceae cyanobacterium RM2_2_10]